MRSNLYRLGRYAARRPWVVIGAWLVVAALVIAASGAFGKKLEESFGAPGVDSQSATDLLSAAGADQAGLTAQVVVTPLDEQATLNSPELRAALTQIRSTAASLPHVLEVGDPVISPDGRVGLIRLQYPVLDKLEPSDLEQLKTLTAVASPLRIELGGDLFSAFEEGPGRPRRGVRADRRDGHPAARVRIDHRDGAADRNGRVRPRAGDQFAVLGHLSHRAAQLGARTRQHDRARRGHRLRAAHRHPAPRVPGPRDGGRGVGRACCRHGRAGCALRRWHSGDRDPRSGGGRRTVHDRRRDCHLTDRADHGARFAHLAARVPGSGRALDQSPSGTAGAGVPWFGLAAVGGACVQARRRLRRRRHRPAAGAGRTRARTPRRYAR